MSNNKRKTLCVFSSEEEVDDSDQKKLREFTEENASESAVDCEPLVLERSQEVLEKFMETMTSIAEKWAYLGLSRNCVEKRLESILNMVVELYSDAELHEQRLVEYLTQEKEIMENNLKELAHNLDLPEYEPTQGNRFVEILHGIIVKYEELSFIKKERVTKWTELLTQKHSLCDTLGLSPEVSTFPDSFVPSENDIQQLQTNVLELKKTANKMKKMFICNQKAILALIVELEIDVDSVDIRFIDENEPTILSEAFIKEQQSFLRTLQTKYDDNEKQKIMMEERLTQLWDKLEIDEYTRKTELDGVSGWKPSDLEKLQELVVKYEELKRQNMSTFILKLREEIENYWTKIFASPEDEEEFAIYMCEEDFTEALLTAHEQELERLKARYLEHREIYESLDTWLECWAKYLDLEKKMNDPNRFNNRGGVMLKQEKEKKRTQKELLRCEKVIKTLSEKWSAENFNAPFLASGKPIMEFIEDQKTLHQVIKAHEKKERAQTKSILDAKRKAGMNKMVTPNIMQRTPVKVTGSTPASGVKPGETRRLQNSVQPLSPVNHELRSRLRPQVSRLGIENRCNSNDRRRVTPGSIKTTPHIPTLDKLVDEEKFKALLQDRKHETLESTSLSKKTFVYFTKSRDTSPIDPGFQPDNMSRLAPGGYGELNRRKSRSYTLLSLRNVGDIDEPLYKPTSPKLTRWGSAQSVKSNKSLRSNSVFSPRPPFRP